MPHRRWLIVFALIAVSCSTTKAKDRPPGSGSEEHPAVDDVTITSCATDPSTGWVKVNGEILNHSSKPSTYFISVNILDATGTKIDEVAASSSNVDSRQRALWDGGTLDVPPAGFTCDLVDVTRFAAD